MVDRIVESDKFALGIRRVKASCVAADMESGKEMVWKHVATIKFNSSESSFVAQSSDSIHAS